MKVRFKSNVTRGFSFSPLRDSCSPLRGSLIGKKKKNLWDQGNLFQIFYLIIQAAFLFAVPCNIKFPRTLSACAFLQDDEKSKTTARLTQRSIFETIFRLPRPALFRFRCYILSKPEEGLLQTNVSHTEQVTGSNQLDDSARCTETGP